jgi:hypothetical protein
MAIDWRINRRGLFYGGAAALVGGALGLTERVARANSQFPALTLMSAARIDDVDGGALLCEEGLCPFALPARAHALARLPKSDAVVVVGRRPGTFAAIVDAQAPQESARFFTPLGGYRFAGHAAVSENMLVTSEMDEETAEGSIVLRDAGSAAPKERFSVGIEPHDVLFARGGETLVVAIGGIAHAAEVKGPALNAGNIDSHILELDPCSGAVLKRHALPFDMKSLSLRHMALAPDGQTVAFGMQDQDRSKTRPVMGLLRLGRGIDLLPLPAGEEGGLRSYIGSVAIDASGRFVAATSPKGGSVGLWSISDGRWLGSFTLADVCGLTAADAPASFWATSGHGNIVRLHADDEGLVVRAQWHAPAAFDNHLLRI